MRDGFLAVVTGQGSLLKALCSRGAKPRGQKRSVAGFPRRTRLDSRWGRRGQAKASRTLPKATLQRRRGTECGRRASEGLFWPNAACSNQPASTEGDRGQVAEWLNAPHSKCGIPARVSGVQIPPCPPSSRSGIDPVAVLKNQWLAAARVVHTGGYTTALAMSGPWKPPKAGICWFRKRVPGELRALLGKTEVKQSLGTRDPSEAKLEQAEVLVAVETCRANLKVGPRSLSEREAQEFARSAPDTRLARDAISRGLDRARDALHGAGRGRGRTQWGAAPAPGHGSRCRRARRTGACRSRSGFQGTA